MLWDYVNIIEAWFADWKRTPWKKIDVEGIDFECKRFGKELRGKINNRAQMRPGEYNWKI